MTMYCMTTVASTGVSQAGADAVDGGGDGSVEFGIFGFAFGDGFALATDEFDLDQAHGVDVGVAQADGALEDWVGLKQAFLAGDLEDHALGEVELGFEGGEDSVAQG